MSGHACATPYPMKQAGRCLCCRTDCYEVREIVADGPLEGHPRRRGPMLEHGTQVEFVLSDGAEASITFCLDCATALTPDQYQAVWDAVIERNDLSLRLAGRSENERAVARAAYLAVYPIAIARKRREAEPGVLMVDRR